MQVYTGTIHLPRHALRCDAARLHDGAGTLPHRHPAVHRIHVSNTTPVQHRGHLHRAVQLRQLARARRIRDASVPLLGRPAIHHVASGRQHRGAIHPVPGCPVRRHGRPYMLAITIDAVAAIDRASRKGVRPGRSPFRIMDT